MPKRKTLPKNFEALLKAGDEAALRAVFETCDLDARGGYSKQTALAFDDCPDALARWLVEAGADLHACDQWGHTPLHSRAGSWRGRIGILLELGADAHRGERAGGTPLHTAAGAHKDENARLLLAGGARVDALDKGGFTPLERALQRCGNVQIEAMAKLAATLLDAGARRTGRMKDYVNRIGTDFEFHRSNFAPELRESTGDALERLYALFEVPPVPCRTMHDGKSPIVATASRWEDRHRELWELLVPSSGAARTVQGEVIRISGRIADELDGNGGVNWDARYRRMAQAWLAHVGSGNPLSLAELEEGATIVAGVKRGEGDTRRLCELSVAWVALNPAPIDLPPPDYDR